MVVQVDTEKVGLVPPPVFGRNARRRRFRRAMAVSAGIACGMGGDAGAMAISGESAPGRVAGSVGPGGLCFVCVKIHGPYCAAVKGTDDNRRDRRIR